MKQETFSKAEMLHHFENLMPKNNKGKAKYVGDSNFLPVCTKLNLVKCLNRRTSEYIFVKPFISILDINDIIASLKAKYKKHNITKRSKPIINLDALAKQVAASGLYRIDEDGKLYKKTVVWKEM